MSTCGRARSVCCSALSFIKLSFLANIWRINVILCLLKKRLTSSCALDFSRVIKDYLLCHAWRKSITHVIFLFRISESLEGAITFPDPRVICPRTCQCLSSLDLSFKLFHAICKCSSCICPWLAMSGVTQGLPHSFTKPISGRTTGWAWKSEGAVSYRAPR